MFTQLERDEQPLDHAIRFVTDEAITLAGTSDPFDPDFRRWAALSAMSFVQHRVSSVRFSLGPTESVPPWLATGPVNVALGRESGVCGHHVQIFVAILQAMDVPVRDIQVFYGGPEYPTLQGHVFAEVQFEDAWHMFDVSWGFIPLDDGDRIRSYREVKHDRSRKGLRNEVDPWNLTPGRRGNPLDFLDGDWIGELISGSGHIDIIHFTDDGETREFDLTGTPPLGDNSGYDLSAGNVTYGIPLPLAGRYQMTLSGVDGQEIDAPARIQTEQGSIESSSDGTILVAEEPHVVLSLHGEQILARHGRLRVRLLA